MLRRKSRRKRRSGHVIATGTCAWGARGTGKEVGGGIGRGRSRVRWLVVGAGEKTEKAHIER